MRTWVEKVESKSRKMCARCQLLASLHFAARTSILFVLHVLHVADWSIGFSLLAPVWTKPNEVQPCNSDWNPMQVVEKQRASMSRWTPSIVNPTSGALSQRFLTGAQAELLQLREEKILLQSGHAAKPQEEFRKFRLDRMVVRMVANFEELDFTCFILLNFRLRHIRPRSMECTLFALARGKRVNCFRLYSLHFNLNSCLVMFKHVRNWVHCVCVCVFCDGLRQVMPPTLLGGKDKKTFSICRRRRCYDGRCCARRWSSAKWCFSFTGLVHGVRFTSPIQFSIKIIWSNNKNWKEIQLQAVGANPRATFAIEQVRHHDHGCIGE